MRQPRPRPARTWRPGWAASPAAELVIEAVFEDFDLKARLLAELSAAARRRGAGRDQHELPAGRRPRPACGATRARSLGLHYFSPAAVNPIVEVVQGDGDRRQPRSRRRWRSARQRQAAAALPGQLRLCRSTASSAPTPTRRRARSTTGWARPAEIDAVAQDGAGCGRRAVRGDEPDQAAHQPARDPQPRPARDLLRAGAGRWSQAGEADRPFAIGAATALARAGRERQIADRLLCGCFLPVLQALDEDVAEPAAFDLGAREALKFGDRPVRADGPARPRPRSRASSSRLWPQHRAAATGGAGQGRHADR